MTEHTFQGFWSRWRGLTEGRLANQNEGKEEARVQWGRLSIEHRNLAYEWGPHFQTEFRKANGDDCSMLHCCRYLSKKRFLNYEGEEPVSATRMLTEDDESYWPWVEHRCGNAAARAMYEKGGRFHNKLAVPSEWPPGHEEAGQ